MVRNVDLRFISSLLRNNRENHGNNKLCTNLKFLDVKKQIVKIFLDIRDEKLKTLS